MDLKQEQKKLKAEVDRLKEEKAELIEQKSDLAKEINKPIYEAKEKADKMIATAQAEVQGIRDQATREQSDAIIASQRVVDMLHQAKAGMEEVNQKRITLDRDRINFDAERYSLETNVRTAQMDADGLFAKALNLQKSLDGHKLTLDTRESGLIRREQELQDKIASLIKTQEETKQQLLALSHKQEELEKIKQEIEKIGQDSQANLDNNKIILARLTSDSAALQEIQNGINKAQAELDKQKSNMNAQFDILEKNKADIAERETSVHEKERLLEKKSREVDTKIRTLQQLRETK